MAKKKRTQITNHILMVRPANFGFNEQTAASNAFQSAKTKLSKSQIKKKALKEFDTFVKKLRTKGIQVHVAKDSSKPIKPDAIFPNNWVSFHQNGTLITYPMFAPIRRLERQKSVLKLIQKTFKVDQKLAFENWESLGFYLEGTGSMVLDRVNKITYACLSPRTNKKVIKRICKATGYQAEVFNALDKKGQEIYHTNVMMAMGDTFVVIALDSIQNKKERKSILKRFKQTKKEVIEISYAQMSAFAGNMLLVKNRKGKRILVMSTQAYRSLKKKQIKQIEKHSSILHSSINTIEQFGGGSTRCMMAEVFLPVAK